MKYEIKKYGEKILRTKAELVTEFNDETKQIFDDMLDAMYEANGIGLAANQVGIAKRIIVVDLGRETENVVYRLANPEIVSISTEKVTFEEGCLSFPGITENVERPVRITVKAKNENGEEVVIEAEDLLSIVFQHEIDHLNGVVFVDRISPVKKMMLAKTLRNLKKETKESHK